MRVVTDNPRVRDLVTVIAEVVEAGGGYIHPDLAVNHCGSSLWLTLPRSANPYADVTPPLDKPAADGPPLLIIPNKLHVPVTNLEWDDDPRVLRYTNSADHLPRPQQELLDAMVDLFNVCDKVATVGHSYPQAALRDDPELLALVRQARPRWATGDGAANSPAQLVVNSRLRSEMGEGDEGPMGFFMPMIDMLNHHPYGSRYERTDEGHWLIRIHHPNASDQVYVRYNKADAFGVALGLGYFEPATRFVSSVACRFDLDPIGEVDVVGVGVRKRRIPVPRVERTERGLRVSGLVLESQRLDPLVALLGMPLRSMLPCASDATIERLAHDLLSQAVSATAEYFRGLTLATMPPYRAPGGSLSPTSTANSPLRDLIFKASCHQERLLGPIAVVTT